MNRKSDEDALDFEAISEALRSLLLLSRTMCSALMKRPCRATTEEYFDLVEKLNENFRGAIWSFNEFSGPSGILDRRWRDGIEQANIDHLQQVEFLGELYTTFSSVAIAYCAAVRSELVAWLNSYGSAAESEPEKLREALSDVTLPVSFESMNRMIRAESLRTRGGEWSEFRAAVQTEEEPVRLKNEKHARVLRYVFDKDPIPVFPVDVENDPRLQAENQEISQKVVREIMHALHDQELVNYPERCKDGCTMTAKGLQYFGRHLDK